MSGIASLLLALAGIRPDKLIIGLVALAILVCIGIGFSDFLFPREVRNVPAFLLVFSFGALLVGLAVWYVWPKIPPLKVLVHLSNTNYADGTQFAGIVWKKDWRMLHLIMNSPSGVPLEALNLTVTQQPMMAIGQIVNGGVPCSFTKLSDFKITPPSGVKFPDNINEVFTSVLQKVDISSNKWHVMCPYLGKDPDLELAIAIIIPDPGAKARLLHISAQYQVPTQNNLPVTIEKDLYFNED